MMLKKIPVRLKPTPYTIHVGPCALDSLTGLLRTHKLTRTAVIVSQEPIWKSWGSALTGALRAEGIPYVLFLAPARIPSEKLKSFSYFLKILDVLVRADQKSKGVFVVAFGGGVVGDVAGFAAAVYKRGTPFVQIPTTLTAQVDSAIGGKTAIDLPQGKNLVGAFHQPRFVLSDTRMLMTLPDEIYRDGLAEVVKYAVIKDPKFLVWLENNVSAVRAKDPAAVEKIVVVSSRIKAAVVAADVHDTRDLRIVLNFGHTVGHALETACGYAALSHGRAVSIGMCAAVDLSKKQGLLLDPAFPFRLRRLLNAFGLPVTIPPKVSRKKMLEALLYDKKRIGGKNRFVLLVAPGKTQIDSDVPSEAVEDVIRSLYGKSEKPKSPAAQFMRGLFAPGNKKMNLPKAAGVSVNPQGKPRGVVENYLDKMGVAIIRMNRSTLSIGEPVLINGPRTRVTATVGSLQIDRVDVERVKKGDVFGMRVPTPVRPGDLIY